MTAARRVAIFASLFGWIYSWDLFRNLRSEKVFCSFEEVVPNCPTGTVATPPGWIVIMLGLTATVLIATTVCAGMKLPPWPLLSVAGGLMLFAVQGLSEYALMKGLYPGVTVVEGFNSAMRARPLFAVVVLFAVIPTFLVLAGATGMILERRGGWQVSVERKEVSDV